MRHAKAQVKGVDRAQVAQVGCAWGASIDKVFVSFKFPVQQAGSPSQAYPRVQVRADAPEAHLLNRCLCSTELCACVPGAPDRPTRKPLAPDGTHEGAFVRACMI